MNPAEFAFVRIGETTPDQVEKTCGKPWLAYETSVFSDEIDRLSAWMNPNITFGSYSKVRKRAGSSSLCTSWNTEIPTSCPSTRNSCSTMETAIRTAACKILGKECNGHKASA